MSVCLSKTLYKVTETTSVFCVDLFRWVSSYVFGSLENLLTSGRFREGYPLWLGCSRSVKASLCYLGTADLCVSPVDWRWTQRKRQPDSYFSVLNAFIDRKDSYYSIHQIGGRLRMCGVPREPLCCGVCEA